MKPLLLLLLTLCCPHLALASDPPNIILILTDDQGWSQMSAPMDPEVPEAQSAYLETPSLERLIREGMRFTSGYAPAPLCTPTRRSILCGTSAARSGSEFRSAWVPAEHLTIPNALKMADERYRCAHFGKWGEQMISTPEECGFDASDGETGNATGGMPNSLGVKGGHADGPPHFVDNEDPKLTNSVTRNTVAFMQEQTKAGHPFFVQASYYAVHLSVVAKEQTIAKYREKGMPDRGYSEAWAAMLEELDIGIGQILDAIDALGIGDNTYVFFTTDNGGRGTVPGGDETRLATNFPLTGAKHSLWEGGIRVPFLARGPGIQAGSVNRTPVVGYDFLPTFYDLAGGKDWPSDELDGISFTGALAGVDPADQVRPLFFHRPGKGESALRYGAFKLLLRWNAQGDVASTALYNVAATPIEENQDITDQPVKAAELKQLLLAHLKAVDAETVADIPKKTRRKAK